MALPGARFNLSSEENERALEVGVVGQNRRSLDDWHDDGLNLRGHLWLSRLLMDPSGLGLLSLANETWLLLDDQPSLLHRHLGADSRVEDLISLVSLDDYQAMCRLLLLKGGLDSSYDLVEAVLDEVVAERREDHHAL